MFRAAVLSLLVLGACGNKEETEVAEMAVKVILRDPDSAKFRNLEFNENGFVCGEVNSRNAYGGMVGFLPPQSRAKL